MVIIKNPKKVIDFIVILLLITTILSYKIGWEYNTVIFILVMYFPLSKWGMPFLKN